MKKIVLALMMCAAVTGISAQTEKGRPQGQREGKGRQEQSQQRPSAEEKAKRHAEKLQSKLALDDKQYEQVYKLFVEEAKAQEQRIAEEKKKKEAEREKQRAQHEKKMKKILNDAQFEQYTKLMEECRAQGQNCHQRGEGDIRQQRGEVQQGRPDFRERPVKEERFKTDRPLNGPHAKPMQPGKVGSDKGELKVAE